MFKLYGRLKLLKGRLKALNKEAFSDISKRASDAKQALTDTQKALTQDPQNESLVALEHIQLKNFYALRSQEESLFRQKSRIRWLKEGDLNTKFFHQSVIHRHLRNRIISVLDSSGQLVTDPGEVQQVFVSHFQEVLAPVEMPMRPSIQELMELIQSPLNDDQVTLLSQPFLPSEVRDAMFSLAGNKAPGPDGYNADFFKKNWDIVGPSVTIAVLDFLESGRMLKEINNSIIALVPKVHNATSVTDYRPIACCNTIYKCITKLLSKRIAVVLPDLISPVQTAFVKGRRITDNILLAQELFCGFHSKPHIPKCAIKVDFRKAYDTLNWDFLEATLQAFRFPNHFIKLIMVCVRSPKFSIAMNGELHGFFSSGRGLRQGDPISSYLFTLAMEVFTGIINSHTRRPEYRYYWRCRTTRLSHLFFADDVFLFSEASPTSISCIKDGLDLFSAWSGLVPNPNKSEVFISGGSLEVRDQILHAFGFRLGSFPVKYLGVPIITLRLTKVDCHALVRLITARVQSWTHRFLSFAGRLQLIKSVLHSIHVYWASIFWLPSSVVHKIEQICRQFLWKGPAMGPGGAKVSWEDVCLPKQEGGLGLRRIRDSNKAAMIKHIWNLFTDKESLWCKWIHAIHLKRKEFWNSDPPTTCSWAWKKILALRRESLPFFKWKIGDGLSTSLWFDPWLDIGPLTVLFSNPDIYQSDLTREAKVADLYSPLGQTILQELSSWHLLVPTLTHGTDYLTWEADPSGKFSIASAWAAIRRKSHAVPWSSFVWSKAIVPRHQFLLWLITKNRLPTQEYLMSFGRISNVACAFCNTRPDSVDHLFFDCGLPNSLAMFWASKCNLPWYNSSWPDNLLWAINSLSGRGFSKEIARFSFGALCYIIWKTRNNIIFRAQSIHVSDMKHYLSTAVKDKALAFKRVEDNSSNRRMQQGWGIDHSIFDPGPE